MDHLEISKLQYGTWLQGEAPRRSRGEFLKARQEDGRPDREWSKKKTEGSQARAKHPTEERSGARKTPESTLPPLGTGITENETNNIAQGCQEPVSDHEKGKGEYLGEKTDGILPISCKEDCEGSGARKAPTDVMQWETRTLHGEDNLFEFRVAPTNEGSNGIKAQ